jgi:asparagine synthase (glutamine-hydrolysing)
MCGISLIYSSSGATPSAVVIARMNRALQHRGPDAHDVLCRGAVGLGHTRLSIVDIEGGAQPMLTPDGQWAIVFNGEIYNYRELRTELEQQGVLFVTRSDTEVVLHLLQREGLKAAQRLRGMFAYVAHDLSTDTVIIARDRLGIKPLFYHFDGSTLVATSECKAIFASGLVEPKLDVNSIRNYFTYQFAIAPYTTFVGVRELPPGHQLVISKGGVPRIEQYWNLEFPREGEYESLDENFWTKKFADALEDAAATHTIGDVPIGSYLSGGIDSSAMAWLLTRSYPDPLQTFSIHFTNPSMDEAPIYRNIAKHLHVANTEITMDDDRPEGYLADLEQCIYHLEQPQRMAVDIPHFLLSELVRANNYKVVYTGDGADEILGGYDCFRQDMMRIWGNEIADPVQRRAHYLSNYTQDFSRDFVNLLLELHEPKQQQATINKFGCYPVWFDFWNVTADQLPGLFSKDFEQATRDNTQMQSLIADMKPHLDGRHRLNQSMYIETKTRLPGWILWKSDRLSMAHSVEARVPYMDHPLVELAARVPPDLKLNGMNEKYILKKIAQPHLPQHPYEFKKRAFYTPIREWFFTEAHREGMDRYLSTAALEDCGMFVPARVHSLYKQLLASDTPRDGNAYYRVMKLEWVLMSVLTVQILHMQFVRKQAACFGDAAPPVATPPRTGGLFKRLFSG